jgi:hypothetical protein
MKSQVSTKEGEAAAAYYLEQHGRTDLPAGSDAYHFWYYAVGFTPTFNPYCDSGDMKGAFLFAKGFAHYAAIHNPAPPAPPPPPPGTIIRSPNPGWPPLATVLPQKSA